MKTQIPEPAKRFAVLAATFMCFTLFAASVPNRISQAMQYEVDGRFKEAAALLQDTIAAPEATKAELHAAGFELDRLERIRRDFRYTREELFEELKQSVEGLTKQEFDEWVAEGRFDSRVIDRTRFFMGSSVSNLFFRYPELNPRRTPPKPTDQITLRKLQVATEIRKAALESGKAYVLPKTFEATMRVTLQPGVAKPGDEVSAWLPIPRSYPFQTGFEVVSSSPFVKELAPETSPIRSAHFETQARGNEAVKFTITYRFTMHGVSFALEAEKAVKPQLSPELSPFTQEAPHVVFMPEMRELATRIAGSETNSLRRAKRYYDWIGENIQYSYAIEYSTIRNISDYCRSKGYGDCGQEALLFITLCRLDGIPARWQSGWNLFPGGKTIHDWCEIYLEPWGWFPVDPYMSIFASQYASGITREQRELLRDFYFGGLDQYRMAANCDHSQELTPAKAGYRSDTVDFQRGEIDVNGRNAYFDKYTYSLDYREVLP